MALFLIQSNLVNPDAVNPEISASGHHLSGTELLLKYIPLIILRIIHGYDNVFDVMLTRVIILGDTIGWSRIGVGMNFESTCLPRDEV